MVTKLEEQQIVYHRSPAVPPRSGCTTAARLYHRGPAVPPRPGCTTVVRLHHRNPAAPPSGRTGCSSSAHSLQNSRWSLPVVVFELLKIDERELSTGGLAGAAAAVSAAGGRRRRRRLTDDDWLCRVLQLVALTSRCHCH